VSQNKIPVGKSKGSLVLISPWNGDGAKAGEKSFHTKQKARQNGGVLPPIGDFRNQPGSNQKKGGGKRFM